MFPLEILNSQLLNHQLYAKLLCQLTQLNISQIHDILMHDFYWNKTASMVMLYFIYNSTITIQLINFKHIHII